MSDPPAGGVDATEWLPANDGKLDWLVPNVLAQGDVIDPDATKFSMVLIQTNEVFASRSSFPICSTMDGLLNVSNRSFRFTQTIYSAPLAT